MSALEKVLAAKPAPQVKLADGDQEPFDAHELVEAADASLDEACKLFRQCDLSQLPPEARQAVALVFAGSTVIDGLVDELNLPDPDDGLGFSAWVEETAYDHNSVRLADGDSSKPYGDVAYADPGYQSDGKKRYPIDKEHIRAAISYFSKPKNHEPYSSSQIKSIWGRIKAAASKFGIDLSPDTGKVAATSALVEYNVELAGKGGGVAMEHVIANHKPFHGAHGHLHMHLGDNRHGPVMVGLAAASGSGDLPAYHHKPMTGVHDHAHVHANDATHGPIREVQGPADDSW
jgi:hypothetical protein